MRRVKKVWFACMKEEKHLPQTADRCVETGGWDFSELEPWTHF